MTTVRTSCPWCFDGHGVQRCYKNPDGSHVRGCATHNGKHPADWCVFKKRDTASGRFFAPATQVDFYGAYRQVLAEHANLPPRAWTFKSNPAYQQILEHVTPEQGHAYLALAEASPRWSARVRVRAAEIALENDRYGEPVRARFDQLGIFCSPTNLRYLWHTFQILDWIEHLGLPRVNIAEIGGGYGGLALWLHRLAPDTIGSYTIFDLPEATAIQVAYAREHRLSVRAVDVTDDAVQDEIGDRADWFLISNYAFSEFSAEVRDWYQEFVVRQCAHGWLLWNLGPVYPFTDHLYEVEDEQPLTGQGNKVVRF